MKLKAFAKINLNLHLLAKKNKAGFYPVRFLNCQADLADEIEVTRQNKIILSCDGKNMLKNKYCLCAKLIRQLHKMSGKKQLGVNIKITKKIPIKAGLGGCSSVAATLLKALNKTWKLDLSKKQLEKICSELGMDVYYSLESGLCHISGTGKKIKKLSHRLPQIPLVIITPKVQKPSTPWAYKNIKATKIGNKVANVKKLILRIKQKDIKAIHRLLHNDFEKMMVKHYPIIKELKKDLVDNGALSAIMTGAGLSVVGFFASRKVALGVYNKLGKKYKKVFLTKTRN